MTLVCAHEILRSRGDERPAWFHDVDLGDDRLRDRNMAVTFSRLPGVGRHSWLSAPGHRPPLTRTSQRPGASIPAAPGLNRVRRGIIAPGLSHYPDFIGIDPSDDRLRSGQRW